MSQPTQDKCFVMFHSQCGSLPLFFCIYIDSSLSRSLSLTIINKSLTLNAMPPSTRAGQTGRGDDDQTTTGNGQEEGWLTQVVRILQLANPAPTAEEAIVRAMGLISISNQTPRRETEKIPVRGLAPETQVDLSRYSVTIELCDSYCLGIGDYRVVQWRSLYIGFG